MRKAANRTKKGFTLIELLIVIGIIGALSAVVIVSLVAAQAKSRDARRISDVKQIATMLDLYKAGNDNTYPGNPHSGQACNIGGTGADADCLKVLVDKNLIVSLPTGPSGDYYRYYNYGAGGNTVVNSQLESLTGKSPCNFSTGNWCDKNQTGDKHYCVCLK